MQKVLLTLGAFALLLATASLLTSKSSLRDPMYAQKWEEFKVKYNRNFNGVDEEAYRYAVFVFNLQFIEAENKKGNTHTLGENQFLDISKDEFVQLYLIKDEKDNSQPEAIHKRVEFPPEMDWTTRQGKVQRVKDQGQCGSCWAFSAIGSTESADAIFNGHLGDYSEQQLVDCSRGYGNHGCNGGLMNWAFGYIKDNGISTEEAYPYQAVDQHCQKMGGDFKITGFTKVNKKILDSECKDLKSAIAQQPVSVGVDAEQWQFYSKGILTNCGRQLDHGVLAVGYTSTYWKIKNSWGTSWGEEGFIRIGKGNTCGVCNTASYPNTK